MREREREREGKSHHHPSPQGVRMKVFASFVSLMLNVEDVQIAANVGAKLDRPVLVIL
jgi:hypothetical protein